MAEPAYKRSIVKVSGEALAGSGGYGIHQPTIDRIAADLVRSRALGVALGVVVGGGGGGGGGGHMLGGGGGARPPPPPPPPADAMGMLATVVNGLVLEAAIE